MEKELSKADHAIAADMLFEVKASIKDLAAAITESATEEIHQFLAAELKLAISHHEKIYSFLQDRGIYDAYNVPDQLKKDVHYAERTLQSHE
ncbi:spore coat protein [Jeotgalibacillus proteolyticus]|uniref:spore coat protein n=1 Tax=Jeotgalibacillus proteolyticus TaxID=2082395 RepID=UPI003CF2D9B7